MSDAFPPDGAPGGEPEQPITPVPRTARHRRRRIPRVVIYVAATIVVLVAAVITWYELEEHPLGNEGPAFNLFITKGETADNVISALAQHGAIHSTLAFRLYDLIHGTPTIGVGGYRFHTNMSFGAVRALLNGGPNVFAVTAYPGYTLAEVSRELDDVPGHSSAAFSQVATAGVVSSPYEQPGSHDLEGLIGAGTYIVNPGETDRQLLTAMVARFDTEAQHAGLTAAAAAALGQSAYEIATVASVVEKEGYIVKNMGKVSRVIYNRLANDQALQMDSTVLYSLGQDGGPVTPADLQLNTPYNTYLHKGLPPTPICTPSQTALDAALNPTPGSWRYFTLVSKDGTMAFVDTYAEQLANERLAQSRGLP
jgi:UPF0755 protein